MAFFYVIKGLFIFASVFLGAGLVFSAYKGWRFHHHFSVDAAHAKRVRTLGGAAKKDRWEAIIRKLSLGTPESARAAVVEADAFVNDMLKGMGLPGEHLADRLAELDPQDATSIEGVWSAHRLRNDLVHTPGFEVELPAAQKALEAYEAFLKEMEIL